MIARSTLQPVKATACLLVLLAKPMMSQTFWTEDFESEMPSYVATPAEFSDGNTDFFTRVGPLGNMIGSSVVYNGFTGTYFAAMDTNAEGTPDVVTLLWTDAVEITDDGPLEFCGLFAEDSDGSNEDWDANSSVIVRVKIDSGEFLPVLAFEASGGTNTDPRQDTNFDGIGDGTPVTDTATEFCGSISGTSGVLSILLTISNLQDGDEDIAFDNLVVRRGTPVIPMDPLQVKIHEIQGAGSAAPPAIMGSLVEVQGVVVGDFQGGSANDLNGFFLQEETVDEDGDPMTSEGIFVFDGTSPQVDVGLYDTVKVIGTVNEFFDKTQITATAVLVVSTVNALASITKASITLGGNLGTVETGDFEFVADLERYEGMLVEFPQKLLITEMFNLDRFGQAALSQGSPRPFQFAQQNVPDDTGYLEHLKSVAARTIFFDDGSSVQNPDPVDLFGFSFSTADFHRMGDSVEGLTGVLDFSFAEFRIHAIDNSNIFSKENMRPLSPPEVGGTLKIVSFNVLNYFVSLDNGGPVCGPNADLRCRGADNQAEFERQQSKTTTALAALDADIVGLVEIENDAGNAAAADIVAQLNAVSSRQYEFVATGPIGGDAIRVGLIYDTATVTTTETFQVLDSSTDANFIDTKNRPVLVKTFTELSSGGALTVAVCHFKSKGSSCSDVDDPDTMNGSGNCDGTRSKAASALATFLASSVVSSQSPNVLILGDLNAYAMETPIMNLENAGYVNLEEMFEPDPYGFVFDGQLGTLDYALSNPSLASFVVGTKTWHINADEADLLDYNTDFGRNADLFDGSVPFRSSDHDPIIVGIEFTEEPSAAPSGVPSVRPSGLPSSDPSGAPSLRPSGMPSSDPSSVPSPAPVDPPTDGPPSAAISEQLLRTPGITWLIIGGSALAAGLIAGAYVAGDDG